MKKAVKSKHPVLNKIATVISILLATFIVVCLGSIITTKYIYHQPASLFGVRIVKILTDSMDPYIKPNSYIIVKRADGMAVQPGDYVVFLPATGEFAGKGITITHECIEAAHYDERQQRWFITTQGKKVGAPVDDPVPVENVQSVYIGTIGSSGFLNFVTSRWGIVVLVALPCLAGVILQIVSMVKAVKDAPDEAKVQEAAAQLEEERKAELQRAAIEEFVAQQSVLAFLASQRAQQEAPPADNSAPVESAPSDAAPAVDSPVESAPNDVAPVVEQPVAIEEPLVPAEEQPAAAAGEGPADFTAPQE